MTLPCKTQRAKILALLVAARGAWVSLPEILALNIAQYGARIFELRRLGFAVENKTERVNGVQRSWFRLVPSPAQRTPDTSPPFELVP